MEHRVPFRCPACESVMQVSELTCPSCDTRVQGHFSVSPLLRLTPQQLSFIEVFIQCRGNIREVERALNISYPTVRARLDEVIQSLGYETTTTPDEEDGIEVIQQFEKGELSFEEALDKLRKG